MSGENESLISYVTRNDIMLKSHVVSQQKCVLCGGIISAMKMLVMIFTKFTTHTVFYFLVVRAVYCLHQWSRIVFFFNIHQRGVQLSSITIIQFLLLCNNCLS